MSEQEKQALGTGETAAPGDERDVNPEYVRDLLSRLRETMAVIREEEEHHTEAPVPPAATAENTAAPEEADGEDDGVPPWEIPEEELAEDGEQEMADPTEEADPAEEADVTSACAEAEIASAVTPEPEAAPAPETEPETEAEAEPEVEAEAEPEATPEPEELSLNSLIDELIAEGREKKREAATAAPATARAARVTADIMEEAAPQKEAPAPAVPPAEAPIYAVEVPVHSAVPEAATDLSEAPESAPAVEETPAKPRTPDGIWAMASVASEAAAARKKARRRRFRIRYVKRCDEAAAPAATPIGEACPLFATESTPEDTMGTLRPQDFFIADLRHEGTPASDKNEEEYVSRNQIETILAGYAEEKRQTGIRFYLSLFISLAILVFENLSLLGVSVPQWIGVAPRVHILLDIGLFAAVILCALPILCDGIHELFAWRFGTPAIALLSAGVSLCLAVASLAVGSAAAPLPLLPAALCATMALGFARMRVRDAEKTFLHLCESGDKLAAEILPSVYATEEVAALGRRIRGVLRVKKVGFVTGYFARMKQKREDYRHHTALLLATLGVMTLVTILYLALAPSYTASDVLSLLCWMAAPLSLSVFLAARSLPFHHLVEEADAHGTAVLGESAAEDYAAVDAVAFEDVEAYPSRKVRVRRIKMYDNSRLDEVLYYLASLFSVLGGPLDGVFRVSAAELGISDDVTLHTSGREGLEATVDGARLRVGKWGYFRREEVDPYYDSEDVYKEDAGNIGILYVSVDGAIHAKLYIEYNLSRHFEKIVRRLHKNGIYTLVRSFDPCIGDQLLATTVHYPGLRIRAVKKKPDQICDFAEARIESGIVTGAGSRDLLYTFFLCQNYRKATGLLRLLKVIATPLSCLAALLVPYFAGISGYHSVYGAAISLVWLLPVYLISRFYFKKER